MNSSHALPWALSPEPKGLTFLRAVMVYSSRPSMVVYILPRVPGTISKSSSGIATVHVSLLKTSLLKSASLWKSKVILVALLEMPPPYLISLLL